MKTKYIILIIFYTSTLFAFSPKIKGLTSVFKNHHYKISIDNNTSYGNIDYLDKFEKAKEIESIEDGWYEATVKYSNYSTGTNSTYRLKVEVKYGSVTKIDFGNGGSVHNGLNNEGYTYSGGYLNFETDYNGKTVAATTTVTVYDPNNNMRYFKIRIE